MVQTSRVGSAPPFPLALTAYERFMWRNARPHFPSMFSVWLALDGDVDSRLLDRALSEARAWQPLLGAVISGRGRRARWPPAAPGDAPVRWTDDCRTAVEPPDVSRGPSLRVVGSPRPGGVDLAADFHHAACDGVGGIEFLGDVFAAYSQLASRSARAEPVRPFDPQALERRSGVSESDPLGRRIARGAAAAAWFAGAMGFRPSPVARVSGRRRGAAVDPDALFRLPEVRLERDQAAVLRALASAADASLNGVLLVEVLLAGVRAQTAALKERRQPSKLDGWIAVLATRPTLLDAMLAAPTSLFTAGVSNLGSPAERVAPAAGGREDRSRRRGARGHLLRAPDPSEVAALVRDHVVRGGAVDHGEGVPRDDRRRRAGAVPRAARRAAAGAHGRARRPGARPLY